MTTAVKFPGIALLLFSVLCHASDLAKERRWADQIVDGIMDGEAVTLNDGNNDFLGIYTGAAEDKGRAVIVMHGTGIHPDWPQVVQPLRVGLAEHGWNTLAIQLPVLRNDADYSEYAPLYDEVAPRIEAAIRYLRDSGASDIVLVGHSQGASMTAYYLSKNRPDVRGFVAIGMGVFAGDARMDSIGALENIDIPVLDLSGSEDLEIVLSGSDARAAAARKAGNGNYTQVQVAGANHMFDGRESELVEAVAAWLETLPGRQ